MLIWTYFFHSHVMEETYDMVFFKITHLMQQMDEEVANVLDSMESLDFIQVGLPEGRTVRRRVERAGNTLRQIGTFRTPAEKLECLLCSITQLSESTDEGMYKEWAGCNGYIASIKGVPLFF